MRRAFIRAVRDPGNVRLFSSVPFGKTLISRIPREVYADISNTVPAALVDGAGTIIDPRCTALIDFFARIAKDQSGRVIDLSVAKAPMGCSKPLHFEHIYRHLFPEISDTDLAALVQKSMSEFESRFESEVATADLVQGVKATIRALTAIDCNVAVNSSYPTPVLSAALNKHGLTLPFVTPDDVPRGRPSSDMLKMLSVSLGVNLSECIVIGDTPSDVLAGRNARAWTAVVTETSAFAEGEGVEAERAVLEKLDEEAAEPNLVMRDFTNTPDACLFLTYLMSIGLNPGAPTRFHLTDEGVDVYSSNRIILPGSKPLKYF